MLNCPLDAAGGAFGKALFHASLLSLCLIGVCSVLLPVVFGFSFSDF